MSDMGIASTTLTVLETEPRKNQHMIEVRRIASSSSNFTSETECSMNSVESNMTRKVMPSGRPLPISTTSAFTAWATSTAFAPRCFRMPMPWAGSPAMRVRRRVSSKPSSTSARSERRTTEVPDWRTTTSRKASSSMASPRTRTLISRPSVSMRPAGISTCSRRSAACTSAVVSP